MKKLLFITLVFLSFSSAYPNDLFLMGVGGNPKGGSGSIVKNGSLTLSASFDIVEESIVSMSDFASLTSLALTGEESEIGGLQDSLEITALADIPQAVISDFGSSLGLSTAGEIAGENIGTIYNEVAAASLSEINQVNIGTLYDGISATGQNQIDQSNIGTVYDALALLSSGGISELDMGILYDSISSTGQAQTGQDNIGTLYDTLTATLISQVSQSDIGTVYDTLALASSGTLSEANIGTVYNSLTATGISEIVGEGEVVAGGYVLEQEFDTTGSSLGLAWSSDTRWGAGSFTTVGGYTLTKVEIALKKVGTPTGNSTVSIWASSGDPYRPTGTALVTCSTLDNTTLTTDYAYYPFTCTGTALDASTKYFIVIDTANTAQEMGWSYVNTGTEEAQTSATGEVGSWSSQDGSCQMAIKTYSGTP